MNQILLATRNLKKSYNKTPVLHGLDLDIATGEVLAVMGPSGSGKSTLLHCLAGIIKPDAGSIKLAGKDITQLNDEQRSLLRRTEFGFVFQFGQLVPELTAVDNVALPLLLANAGKTKAYAEAKKWLADLGLTGLEKRRSSELSGGQAQRVAIARAMIIQPKVLFADEPTGSLDTLTGEKVMNIFLDTARKHNTTVVIITHEPRIAALADREIIVRDGVITAGGMAYAA